MNLHPPVLHRQVARLVAMATKDAPTSRPPSYHCPFCGNVNTVEYPSQQQDIDHPTNETCEECDAPQNIKLVQSGSDGCYEISWFQHVDSHTTGWAEEVEFDCPACGLLHTASFEATDFDSECIECDGHALRAVRSLMPDSPNPYVSYKIAVHQEQPNST